MISRPKESLHTFIQFYVSFHLLVIFSLTKILSSDRKEVDLEETGFLLDKVSTLPLALTIFSVTHRSCLRGSPVEKSKTVGKS